MTFETVADLLADPVLGKLEEVREYRNYPHRLWLKPEDIVKLADAALLAVANARGTCENCDHENEGMATSCLANVAVFPDETSQEYDHPGADFGCCRFTRRQP